MEKNIDIAKNIQHLNSIYLHLNYIYDSLLENQITLVSLKKFQNFLGLPLIFSKNLYDLLQGENNLIKRKKLFMEICFVFFNSYSVADKSIFIEYVYKTFKTFDKN